MPDPEPALTDLAAWLQAHWLALVVLAVAAFIAFQAARPLVHRLVLRAARISIVAGDEPDVAIEENTKRIETVEDLLARFLRASVVIAVVLAILTVLDLLPVIAGLGLIAAAITIAGQDIVLDILMGILILLEGQYYKGDWISVGTTEGSVEEVGLRRTVLRDATGTVHSISNGLIRSSSNFTRLYASLQLDITVRAADLDRATAVVDRVGEELAADPIWSAKLLDVPRFVRVVGLVGPGVTMRVGGRVRAPDRWSVPGELRQRIAVALDREDIVLLGAIPPGLTIPPGPPAPAAPPGGPAPVQPAGPRPAQPTGASAPATPRETPPDTGPDAPGRTEPRDPAAR